MSWDCGFGELENRLIEAGKEYPPNYEKMRELLAAGANINATSTKEDPDESILSTIILGYPEFDHPEICESCDKDGEEPCTDCPENFWKDYDGRYLPDLCRFFLQNGFDVHGSKDTFGGRCIMNLTWSSYDRYILDATKILLHAGANPNFESDHETLLSWVATKASAGRCVDEDHNLENLFETMYSILEAASENRDFDSIEYFSAAIGRKVDGIEIYCEPNQPSVFTIEEPEFQSDNCFTGTIVFWCEGKALRINQWTDIMIDPSITQMDGKTKVDMSPYFSGCIGCTLSKIDFDHELTIKGTTRYGRAVMHLHFSNGKRIHFSNNFGKASKEKYAAFFEI